MQTISTKFGDFSAVFSDKGLAGLSFPRQEAKWRGAPAARAAEPETIAKTAKALAAVLEGRQPAELPALDLQGTPFQLSVWRTLASIPPGQTMSYGEIAKAIGKPKAFRAVGRACGANPVPALIPCHRALAANKKIGGFSGGAGWKERLLQLEGSAFSTSTHRR